MTGPRYGDCGEVRLRSLRGFERNRLLLSTAIASNAIIPRMDAATLAVGSFLLLLTLVSVSVSINILLRRSIWRSLKPASRPRRWF